MRILSHSLGPLAANLILLVSDDLNKVVVVDPGLESGPVHALVGQEGWSVERILNTHAHFDHIAGNAVFHAVSRAPIALHSEDWPLYQDAPTQAAFFGMQCDKQPMPTDWLQDNQVLDLLGREWTVLHTPGHSPGSVCFYSSGHLLAGDLLFAGSVGRVDLPGGSWEAMCASLRRVFELPAETIVYPGHGPQTTLGEERARNPFVAMALEEGRGR